MTQRFEFEVDTTHANENWEREVQENLRRRAQEQDRPAGSPDGVAGGAAPGTEVRA